MIEIDGWPGAASVLVAAASAPLVRVARAYIGHRTRLHVESHRSARAAGLVQLAGDGQISVRVRERDFDGDRVMELNGGHLSAPLALRRERA